MLSVGLIGNPNSGKSTLFSALTGLAAQTGNWSGVTVKVSSHGCSTNKDKVKYIDCPGIYSLSQQVGDTAKDSSITIDQIKNNRFDAIINVIDASSLGRSLYLTSQLLDLGVPIIVVLNMSDIAKKKGIRINAKKLASYLNCQVIQTSAIKKQGIALLQSLITKDLPINQKPMVNFSQPIQNVCGNIINQLGKNFNTNIKLMPQALWLLESSPDNLSRDIAPIIRGYQHQLTNEYDEDIDVVIADERYYIIDDILKKCQFKQDEKSFITTAADYLFMHKYLGVPIFFSVIYLTLSIAINVGSIFQEFFDSIISMYYINNLQYVLVSLNVPEIIVSILTVGLGQGFNTIVSFIPILGAVFALLSFLESSGYIARATFALDKIFYMLGLPSKAFMPLIIGFGCNVPSIMATRSMNSKNDRLVTILMSPFISCTARLAVYTVFAAVFFKNGGHNIIFILYMVGIACALLTGFLLRNILENENRDEVFYEMPSYKLPSISQIYRQTKKKIIGFLNGAGKYILYTCVILSILNDNSLGHVLGFSGHNILMIVGKIITPLFGPIGIDASNWPATVAILTGALAKETVLGTLNTLYSSSSSIKELSWMDISGLYGSALAMWNSMLNLPFSIFSSIDNAPFELSSSSRESLALAFGSNVRAFSYLLFLSLYLPCISTAIIIGQELNKNWMFISIVWSVILAYTVSLIFYQIATIHYHPISTILAMSFLIVIFLAIWKYSRTSSKFKLQGV